MSIAIIAQALEIKVGSAPRKLVLVKLADNANDAGKCWPSLKHICEQTELSERSVRNHIRSLEGMGLVFTEHRQKDGVNLPSVYHLRLQGSPGEYAANDAGVGHDVPGGGAGDAGGVGHEMPGGGASGAGGIVSESSTGNRQGNPAPHGPPSRETAKQRTERLATMNPLPGHIPADAWAEYVRHRHETGKAMTDRAAKMALNKLEKMHQEGLDVREALEQSVANGWQGLFPPRKNARPDNRQAGEELTRWVHEQEEG